MEVTAIDIIITIGWLVVIGIIFGIIMMGFHYSINGIVRCLFHKEPETTPDAGGGK